MTSHANNAKPVWEQPESRRLEFKESFPSGDRLARTVIAFANGAGGKIVFGIKDKPRAVIGIPDNEIFSLEERISNHIFSHCEPVILPKIYIHSAAGKNLLVVEVYPGTYRPYYLKSKGKRNGTFIRVGSTNRQASEEMLAELERQRRNISFDSLPAYDVPWKEINLNAFASAFAEAVGTPIKSSQFKNMGLLIKEQDHVCPSNAAVLLSDSEYRKILFPFGKVECARFKGSTPEVFLDQASMDMPIYRQPDACMDFIKKNIALSASVGEVYRKNRWEYPLKAVREAVINAIIHRDYSLAGSDIKIAIFDDMFEITSPGPLPDTVSLDELGTGISVIRNKILARIFKDMGLIEAWGTGMVKIRQAVSEYPEMEVMFRETGYAFQVQFIKHK